MFVQIPHKCVNYLYNAYKHWLPTELALPVSLQHQVHKAMTFNVLKN